MGLKNVYDAKPIALYILGRPAEGDLKRPFKAGGFMGGAFFHSCIGVGHRFVSYQLLRPRKRTRLQSTRQRSVLRRRTSRLGSALACLFSKAILL